MSDHDQAIVVNRGGYEITAEDYSCDGPGVMLKMLDSSQPDPRYSRDLEFEAYPFEFIHAANAVLNGEALSTFRAKTYNKFEGMFERRDDFVVLVYKIAGHSDSISYLCTRENTGQIPLRPEELRAIVELIHDILTV